MLLVALSPQTHLVEVEVDHLCDLTIVLPSATTNTIRAHLAHALRRCPHVSTTRERMH